MKREQKKRDRERKERGGDLPTARKLQRSQEKADVREKGMGRGKEEKGEREKEGKSRKSEGRERRKEGKKSKNRERERKERNREREENEGVGEPC